jgi:hypothetical protein
MEPTNELITDTHQLKTYLTKEELIVLYKWLQHEFISYENLELTDVIHKITKIANSNSV